jgi:hypothetical protein
MSLALLFAATDPAEIGKAACNLGNDAIGCGTGLLAAGGFVNNMINTVIVLIGALSVIMIIIGGLRYTLSGGDAAGLKSAKDTILYALIGLAVSLLSFAMVSFVISRLG